MTTRHRSPARPSPADTARPPARGPARPRPGCPFILQPPRADAAPAQIAVLTPGTRRPRPVGLPSAAATPGSATPPDDGLCRGLPPLGPGRDP